MKNKISLYLYTLKIKFIIITLFFLSLFIQIINLIEVARISESKNFDIIQVIYLSILKLPSSSQQITPFVIIISTAFFYRYLLHNTVSYVVDSEGRPQKGNKTLTQTKENKRE